MCNSYTYALCKLAYISCAMTSVPCLYSRLVALLFPMAGSPQTKWGAKFNQEKVKFSHCQNVNWNNNIYLSYRPFSTITNYDITWGQNQKQSRCIDSLNTASCHISPFQRFSLYQFVWVTMTANSN